MSRQKQGKLPLIDIFQNQSPGQSILPHLPREDKTSGTVHYEGFITIQADSPKQAEKLLNKQNYVVHLDAADKENQSSRQQSSQQSSGKQQSKSLPVPRRPREPFVTTINLEGRIGEDAGGRDDQGDQNESIFPKSKGELNPKKYQLGRTRHGSEQEA
jgi:hypothetical protein